MKRSIIVVIPFYIAIVCMIMAVVVYSFGLANVICGKPMSFIKLANCWLLITIVCYLHEIYKKLTSKPEEEKPKKPEEEPKGFI